MRKFVFSIISIVNMILVGIAYGLGANTAIYIAKPEENPAGNWYQLVFNACGKGYSVANIVAFCLLVIATVLTVLALIPFKCRKYVNLLAAGTFVAAGILVLYSPANYMAMSAVQPLNYYLSGSLIAMGVLLLVAGFLACVGGILEIAQKKRD